MKVLIIDGMGGGIGKAVVERLRQDKTDCSILAVGTNAMATSVMLKAGADQSATGENAAVFNCGKVDVIIGTVGIVMANSMLGEISPSIAAAVSSSDAVKILIPSSKCNTFVTGLKDQPTAQYIDEIPGLLKKVTKLA
jgi:NAD(P)-dependent dehydrogenase (short-subunit alcohol dehydrogenase family)